MKKPAEAGFLCASLPDELIDVTLAKACSDIVLAAFVDAGEDIVKAGAVSVRVAIDHRAIDLKHGDHFLDMRIDDERVRFARRFIHI